MTDQITPDQMRAMRVLANKMAEADVCVHRDTQSDIWFEHPDHDDVLDADDIIALLVKPADLQSPINRAIEFLEGVNDSGAMFTETAKEIAAALRAERDE